MRKVKFLMLGILLAQSTLAQSPTTDATLGRSCATTWPPKPVDMVTIDTSVRPSVGPDGYLHSPCSTPEDVIVYTVPVGRRFILTWVHAFYDLSRLRTLIEKTSSLNEIVKKGETGWSMYNNPEIYSGQAEPDCFFVQDHRLF